MANHRTCTQMRLTPELQAEAETLVLKDNPQASDHQNGENGRTLRVRILNGTVRIKARVRQYANVWAKHANITFDSGDAEIRVNVDSSDASWSYVGTDNLSIPQTQPTMNFGWLTDWLSEVEFSSVILHEFGHALGCIHEHQFPVGGIPWNRPAVYAYYATMGWSRADVDRNLLTLYPSTTTQYSKFDSASIVLYPISAELTISGFSVGWNTQLSKMDKAFIASLYPRVVGPHMVSFATMEVRAWDKPAKDAVKRKPFPTACNSPPTLAVGLNSLDVDNGANIRVNAFISILIDIWLNTTLYSAACTYCTWFPVGAAANDPDFQVGQFCTLEDHPSQSPQHKTSHWIAFKRPYVSPPEVVVWLNKLDMARDKNWRIRATATDVTAKGFTLHLDSWADTVLYSAAAAWIAYPRGKPGVVSGSYSTADIRPWNKPQLANSGSVRFPGDAFRRAPAVLVAFNGLDIYSGHNLRMDSVSKDGLNWYIDSWADTILYWAGASYIAFI